MSNVDFDASLRALAQEFNLQPYPEEDLKQQAAAAENEEVSTFFTFRC